MVRVFMDLAENVAILLAKDRKIVYYEDFDYGADTLDVIFSKLTDLGIEEANVVLHGSISEKLVNGDVAVANAFARESYSDYRALTHLFSALGIPTVFFYEFAGYYLSNLEPRTLLIDQDNSQFKLIVYTDSIQYTSITTEANLSQQVIALCNRYELTRVIDVNSLVHSKLLSYFENVEQFRENLQHRLALFAYTMLTDSEAYRIQGLSALGSGASTIVPPVSDSLDSDNSTKAAEGMLKETTYENIGESKVGKAKKSKRNKKEPLKDSSKNTAKPKSKFSLKSLIIGGVLAAIIIAGSSITSNLLSKKSSTDLQTANTLSERYQKESVQLSAYQRALVAGNTTSASGIGVLSKMYLKGYLNYNATLEGNQLTVVASFRNKQYASKFLNMNKKLFSIQDSSVSTKGTITTVKIVISVA